MTPPPSGTVTPRDAPACRDTAAATTRHSPDRPDDIALLLATRRTAPPPGPH
ncbi:hypothetical protein OHT68_04635 [Streptomyces canus]|uniref:hypothetical protein n=1 Tax=Streptomyces canus TaxID=58343 RepID=UPI002E28E3B0|nr:hypothetical protein [Streptomyces canus]